MKKLNLYDATAAQLSEFANTHLGLETNFRMGKAELIAKLSTAGYDKDHILVPEAPAADPNARAASAQPEAERKMVTIRIPSQPNVPGGKDAVPVGVNGKVYLINRNMDVPVPIEVLKVLETAKQTEYDQGPNGEPINPRDVPSYPFSVLSNVA